jgi:hypothetical protein
VGGFQSVVRDTGQVVPDSVEVDAVLQPGREGGHDAVCVIPGPFEPPVHYPLDPVPQRVEQRRHGQVDLATATGSLIDTIRVASSTIPVYTPTSRPVTIA